MKKERTQLDSRNTREDKSWWRVVRRGERWGGEGLTVTTRLVPGYYVGGGTVCDRTLDQEQVGRAGGCILPSPQTIPVELFT